MKKMGEKGQLELSFGMIFSIILIIIFIAFAFWAIMKFVGIGDEAKTAKFLGEFQRDIDTLWPGTQGTQQVSYNLPTKIEKLCIDRDSYLSFYPLGSGDQLDPKKINNIDVSATTSKENPFCVNNIDGKVNLKIRKDFNKALVILEK